MSGTSPSRQRTGRRGIFFTVDGIFAASLLLLVLLLLPKFIENGVPVVQTSYAATDTTNLLATMQVREINSTYVNSLIASGVISDPNQSVMEQIGEFWAKDELLLAKNITDEVLYGLLDRYEVDINGENLTGSTVGARQVVSARRMVSGITKGRERAGFSSRAIATKITKTTTDVYRFEQQGSGNEGGNGVDITKQVNLSQIITATLYISIHYGNSDINSMKFYVNGNDLGIGKSDWLYDEESNVTSGTQTAFTKVDVTSHLTSGLNTIQFSLRSASSGHAYIQPGTRLEVTYNSSAFYDVISTITERTYLDNIDSHETGTKKSGAWAVAPIHVPPGVTVTNAKLHLRAEDIESYSMANVLAKGKGNCTGLDSSNAYNIRIYLNNDAVLLASNSSWPPSNEIIDADYTLTNLLDPNTNVLSVYLNSYGDCFWGDGDTKLISNAVTNASGSSYVEVSYTRTPLAQEYGKIDITATQLFNTAKSNDVTYNAALNGTIIKSFIDLAMLGSQNLVAKSNGNTIFTTPRPYATPGTLYVDNSYLTSPGLNTFTLKDCPGCYILPYSAYTFQTLVPNQVSYGATFDTEQEALEDAHARLSALLGSSVSAIGISNETHSLGKVPSLWGPAIIEVRVWQ